MAATSIPKPGSVTGPCDVPCKHKDCAENRFQASSECIECCKPIGYQTPFYEHRGELIHAECLHVLRERVAARRKGEA